MTTPRLIGTGEFRLHPMFFGELGDYLTDFPPLPEKLGKAVELGHAIAIPGPATSPTLTELLGVGLPLEIENWEKYSQEPFTTTQRVSPGWYGLRLCLSRPSSSETSGKFTRQRAPAASGPCSKSLPNAVTLIWMMMVWQVFRNERLPTVPVEETRSCNSDGLRVTVAQKESWGAICISTLPRNPPVPRAGVLTLFR